MAYKRTTHALSVYGQRFKTRHAPLQALPSSSRATTLMRAKQSTTDRVNKHRSEAGVTEAHRTTLLLSSGCCKK